MEDRYILVVTTRSQSQKNPEYNQNINFKNHFVTNYSKSIGHFRNNSTNQQSSVLVDYDSKYNIVDDLTKVKANPTLLDLARVLEQRKNIENFLASGFLNKFVNKPVDTPVSKDVNKPSSSNFINEQDLTDNPDEILASVQAPYSPKNPPFYISMKIMDKISHYCLIDGGSRPNVISNKIMEELGLSRSNENPRNMLVFNKQR